MIESCIIYLLPKWGPALLQQLSIELVPACMTALAGPAGAIAAAIDRARASVHDSVGGTGRRYCSQYHGARKQLYCSKLMGTHHVSMVLFVPRRLEPMTCCPAVCRVHYRRPAVCRVSSGLPSVIFRALGKDVFVGCSF